MTENQPRHAPQLSLPSRIHPPTGLFQYYSFMSRMMACFDLVKAKQPSLFKFVWHLRPLALGIHSWAPKERFELQKTLTNVRSADESFPARLIRATASFRANLNSKCPPRLLKLLLYAPALKSFSKSETS